MERVKDKVAIVTGAASGMGKETSILLAKEGAKVVVTDIQLEKLDDTTEKIKEVNGECISIGHDVSKQNDWENVIKETINKFGRIDILVNNAGISFPKPLAEVTEDDWNKVMAINVNSIFMGTKLAREEMKKTGGGSIINIASMAALVGNAGAGPYTASKGAVRAFSKACAVDFAKENIRVNTIHPGYIETEMSAPMFAMPEYRNMFEANTPLPYLGKADDISQAVLFLASDESKFITGIDLPIDGGATAK